MNSVLLNVTTIGFVAWPTASLLLGLRPSVWEWVAAAVMLALRSKLRFASSISLGAGGIEYVWLGRARVVPLDAVRSYTRGFVEDDGSCELSLSVRTLIPGWNLWVQGVTEHGDTVLQRLGSGGVPHPRFLSS